MAMQHASWKYAFAVAAILLCSGNFLKNILVIVLVQVSMNILEFA